METSRKIERRNPHHFIVQRCVLLLFAAVISLTPLIGQTIDQENNTNQQQENQELEKLFEYIFILEKYGPKTMEKQFIRNDFEEKLFKGIKDSLSIVSNQMQSSLDTLLYHYTLISNEARLRKLSFYRLDFGFEQDYFDELNKVVRVRYNYYFERNLKYLYQIEQVLEDNGDLLIEAYGEKEIFPMIFETKYLIGNILSFKGNMAYLFDARKRYEYILGQNPFNREFIPNDDFRIQLLTTILDIYDRLLINTYTYNTDFRKMMILTREKLSYLWKIVDFNHKNQAIKDVKYRRLYTTYAPIMDPESENYKNLYSKYRRDTDIYPVIEEKQEESTTESDLQPSDQGNDGDTLDAIEETPSIDDAPTPDVPTDNSGQ